MNTVRLRRLAAVAATIASVVIGLAALPGNVDAENLPVNRSSAMASAGNVDAENLPLN